ncbi:hypothetical protein Acr_28g0008550 [Actinidia rufa]|uniref:Phytocyanin domain-containing protein n=1 Tax=Actinidia rufa TaxID=165716 RepID=A0A7J0HAL2_9ERIC|nr:hypothetical protein Acr_28g0008550 [Actinidia rufa]
MQLLEVLSVYVQIISFESRGQGNCFTCGTNHSSGWLHGRIGTAKRVERPVTKSPASPVPLCDNGIEVSPGKMQCKQICGFFHRSPNCFPLLLHLETVHATTFIVGDSSGWDFSVGNWTNGKKFKAGDILIFNYDPSDHNVVVVDRNGYNSCTSAATSIIHTAAGMIRSSCRKVVTTSCVASLAIAMLV